MLKAKLQKTLEITSLLLLSSMLLGCNGQTDGAHFTYAPSMLNARSAHSAVLLNNKEILLVGGKGNGSARSAEVYSISRPTPNGGIIPLHSQYYDPATMRLSKDKILIAGTDAIELIDLTRKQSKLIKHFTSMQGYSQILSCGNGKYVVLFFLPNNKIGDGYQEVKGWIYEAKTEHLQAHTIPVLNAFIHKLVMVSKIDSHILLLTGTENSIWIFDSEKNILSPIGQMKDKRKDYEPLLLKDKTILFIGGVDKNENLLDTIELLHPKTKTLLPMGHLKWPRVGFQSTLLDNGNVLITGGYIKSGLEKNTIESSFTEVFDSKKKLFLEAASLNRCRVGHRQTLLPNRTVVVTGGEDNCSLSSESYLSSVEIFNY